jgi:hypothetical protein
LANGGKARRGVVLVTQQNNRNRAEQGQSTAVRIVLELNPALLHAQPYLERSQIPDRG